MDPQEFKPPQNQEEFKKRAAETTTEGARAVIISLRARREALVKPIDQEILFHKKVLDSRGETV